MERLIDTLMELQKKESTDLSFLKNRLITRKFLYISWLKEAILF